MALDNAHLYQRRVGAGPLPGAVGFVARGDQVEVVAVGTQDAGGGAPMARDSLFRVAAITKSVTAAALLILVEDPVGIARGAVQNRDAATIASSAAVADLRRSGEARVLLGQPV
ncbi:serine hydrolase [Streptomyces collinus]|uniref:serine hydrolase n=1 Tax=Streptomyces collinus TaxID=42684 RepID=UPI00363BC21F